MDDEYRDSTYLGSCAECHHAVFAPAPEVTNQNNLIEPLCPDHAPETVDPGGVTLTSFPPQHTVTPAQWARICQVLSDLSTNYQRNQYVGELYDCAGEAAHALCVDLAIPYNSPDTDEEE